MLPELHTLWIEGPLSHLERICLGSMLKQGHKVVLHAYGPVDGVPEKVIVKDAAEVMPYDDSYRFHGSGAGAGRKGSITLFADYFRCILLEKKMGVWMDLDCYCLNPIELPSHGYLFGHEIKTINSSVLHLPSDSPLLHDLLTACRSPNKSPYWLDFRRRYVKRLGYALRGKDWHLGDMGWGIVGPVGLTRLIPRYGLLDKVQPMKAFYPLDRAGTVKLYNVEPYEHLINDPEIKSIHVYAKEKRKEQPVPGSFMDWATKNVEEFLTG